ncbi:hypothetical protein HC723_04135 [Vibrio sp. S11_S32]|uniref:hypothetical protein n=1 Tax=Vibrio sp. S11_S32 TaxID=2720225 RepID=UPI00168054AB|nr:hypothetical protein [Vibrio sp. S11_S32]MBD1575643.1 hypothetical protein [Vibrio sp. S11_S32]
MINKKHISLVGLLGVIVGSAVTYSIVSSTQDASLQQNQQVQQKQLQQVKQWQQKAQDLQADLSKEVEAFQTYKSESKDDKQKIADLTAELEKLKQTQQKVEKTLVVQKKKAVVLKTENKELAKTTELQSDMYEQSHELFVKQGALQTDITKLSTTREKLIAQTKNFTEQCKLFKDGTSWDPKSDSCAKEKLAKEQTIKLTNSLNNKQKQLDELNALIKKLGVKPEAAPSIKE